MARLATINYQDSAEAQCLKPPRFLVDENPSVLLPKTAHARGFEATHVNHRGLHQAKDWDLLRVVAEEDWILVTITPSSFAGDTNAFLFTLG